MCVSVANHVSSKTRTRTSKSTFALSKHSTLLPSILISLFEARYCGCD